MTTRPKAKTCSFCSATPSIWSASRTQTDFKLIASNVLEETYEIHLRNHKTSGSVEIRVPEHLFRWSNWEITASSMHYTADRLQHHRVPPAGGRRRRDGDHLHRALYLAELSRPVALLSKGAFTQPSGRSFF